jgi:preprotein translocase subunit SecF
MIQLLDYRKISLSVSAVLFGLSILAMVVFGLNVGIDFTGGSLLEVEFSETRPTVDEVYTTLAPLDLGAIVAQPVGEENMILKTRFIDEAEHQQILGALRGTFEQNGNAVLERRLDTIGPSVGEQLRNRALYAAVAVLLAILGYIAFAFRGVSRPIPSWQYGGAAIIALVHDVVITMGVFAVLGHYFGVELDIAFVVAMMTVLGYSVNDTIVVFDRIRENLLNDGPRQFTQTVNNGIRETLVRSINTGMATLISLTALFILGGDSIRYFSLALIIGIVLGTYSSIFVASALLVAWNEHMVKQTEKA